MKNKYLKFVIIAVILLIISIGFSLYLKNRKKVDNNQNNIKNTASTSEEIAIKKIDEKMVRMTFFHTGPVIGSIAIPEKWEGHYRLINGGTTAFFQFIDNAAMPAYIFQINYYVLPADGKFSVSNGEKELARKNGIVFTYKKAENNPYNGKDAESFSRMLGQVDAMMLDFKAIKY